VSERGLTSLLREHASKHSVPGAALGILRGGEVTTACYGIEDTNTREPVTSATRFAVGSLGKSMVATAIARLAADALLSLDDPAAEHVPELRGTWGEQSTVRDLLANRSRLPMSEKLEFSGFEGEDDEVLGRFAAAVAKGQPTAGLWSYTNAGWCLLGRAIEKITGLTWEDGMITTLLRPVAMDETTFTRSQQDEPRASGHTVTAKGVTPSELWAPRALGPAGSTLLSTVGDMLRFAQLHLEDQSLAVLRAPQATVRIHGWLDAWCLGWAQFDWDDGPVWGWDGVISGQRSVLRLMPKRDGAVVLLANGSTGRAACRSLFGELLKEWFEVDAPALSLEPSAHAAGDLSRFAGVYAWPDRSWTVQATDTELVLEGDGRRVVALPLNDRSFLVDAADPDEPSITFGAFDSSGRPGVLYDMLWGLPRV
jgi:CubicO group peptidase (beta-lactamase class C family)